MKGLVLAEEYYRTVGKKMIAETFAAYQDRIATGLVGLGSECFGFDDALSRDHDWGPGFCLWLDQGDYDRIGAPLQQAYQALSDTFLGVRRRKSDWGAGRVGVMEIGDFFESFIGSPHAPEQMRKWIFIPEANLAACTNGKVFYDPLGTFTAIRQQLLAYYPEDVRLKKIAAKCMTAARSGQYNYDRCLKRNAYYAARHALLTFCEDALAMVFLLHRRYMPFYKWACAAARQLPAPGPQIATAVDQLNREDRQPARQEAIEEICAALIKTIKAQGLSDAKSTFLLDHGPRIHAGIRDHALRQLDIWWGGN